MISEIRVALASANEKIQQFETARASIAEPVVALSSAENSTVESVTKCLKCAETENEEKDEPIVLPDPLAGFPSIELKVARETWSTLFHDRREIQHKLANLEQLEKEFQYKIMLKHQKNDRLESISLSALR